MIGDNENLRFVLKKDGKRPLIVIGVNPSIATDKQSDRTIVKVMRFAENNDFDGFIMLNIYPQRSTDPTRLDSTLNPELHRENLEQIRLAVGNLNRPTILCAFGNTISIRPYLKECLRDVAGILELTQPVWKQIGAPTKDGNPRHPCRAAYTSFTDFDMGKYLEK